MKFTQKTIFFIVIIVLVLGAIGTIIARESGFGNRPNYDVFATCLKDKGAVFYGAFWCSHCNAQKKEFSSSAKFLPYVECSTLDGDQNQVCKDAKIMGYPTWRFADGTELTGEIPLNTLAEKTSCELPQVVSFDSK